MRMMRVSPPLDDRAFPGPCRSISSTLAPLRFK
jgi:hypothetical protein